jgi:hypothetical protein
MPYARAHANQGVAISTRVARTGIELAAVEAVGEVNEWHGRNAGGTVGSGHRC